MNRWYGAMTSGGLPCRWRSTVHASSIPPTLAAARALRTRGPRGLGGLAEDRLLGGARLPGIWQAHHAERDQQPGQPGQDGNEQRYLKGEVPGLGVDPD